MVVVIDVINIASVIGIVAVNAGGLRQDVLGLSVANPIPSLLLSDNATDTEQGLESLASPPLLMSALFSLIRDFDDDDNDKNKNEDDGDVEKNQENIKWCLIG